MQQESIKAKIAQAETNVRSVSPVYVEDRVNNYNLDIETIQPTRGNGRNIINLDDNLVPTSERLYYDINKESKVTEKVVSDIEPGDFVTETSINRETTYKEPETIDRPTSASMEEVEEKVEETLQSYNEPMIYEETSMIVAEETSAISETQETEQKETKSLSDTEDGKGSKGGKDSEALEDMTGDAGQNESMGKADEKGQYQQETKGEYAGKKIFELKQNGNFGFNPEHLSITNLNSFMSSSVILLLMIGALVFVFDTRDRNKKNNYF